MNRQSLAFILSQPHVGQAVVILVRGPTSPCMPSQESTASLSRIGKALSTWH